MTADLPTASEVQIGTRNSRRALLGFAVAWVFAVASGFALLGNYEFTPGRVGDAPQRLPPGLEQIVAVGRPLLVMLVHPHCPCTRASLVELEALLAATPEPPQALVVFVLPEGVPDSWGMTDLRSQASGIQGVTVIRDGDGSLSRELGSATSGHILFYDGAGRLRFSGGITPSRGQEGESAGKASLLAILNGPAPTGDVIQSSVYGCPLLDDSASQPNCFVEKANSCRRP